MLSTSSDMIMCFFFFNLLLWRVILTDFLMLKAFFFFKESLKVINFLSLSSLYNVFLSTWPPKVHRKGVDSHERSLYVPHNSPFFLTRTCLQDKERTSVDDKERGNKQDLGLCGTAGWMLDYLIFPGYSLSFIYMQPNSTFSPVCCTPSCSKPLVVHPTSVFWMGQERSKSLWQHPALLGKLSTRELSLQGEITGQEGVCWHRAVPPQGKSDTGKVKLFLLSPWVPLILYVFASGVCWNFSIVLVDFKKQSLIDGWLSKLVLYGENTVKNSYSAMLLTSFLVIPIFSNSVSTPFFLFSLWSF